MESEILRVRDDFEASRLGSAQVRGNEARIELRYETPVTADGMSHDYRLHFTFGLENLTASPLRARVRIGGGDRAQLPYPGPLIYASGDPREGYRLLAVEGASDEVNRYDFDVALRGRQAIYLANCLPRPLSVVVPCLERAAERGGARKVVFGRSLEQRDLIAYEYRNPGADRPLVLVSSGIHPPEPDTLATEALMDFLATEEGQALRAAYDVVVAPVLNPDGYYHGTQAGNAAGINFYWDFRHRDEAHCPEAVALHRYAMELRPAVYFDFHAYTFQRRKHASPYCRPVSRYRGREVRAVVRSLNQALLDRVSRGKRMEGFVTYAPSTLGEKLTRELNTISYAKYHVHLQEGEAACREHAVAAVRVVCEGLAAGGISRASQVLRSPYGMVEREVFREWSRRGQVWLQGYLRPALRRMLNRLKQ